jgi:hypothetical protein
MPSIDYPCRSQSNCLMYPDITKAEARALAVRSSSSGFSKCIKLEAMRRILPNGSTRPRNECVLKGQTQALSAGLPPILQQQAPYRHEDNSKESSRVPRTGVPKSAMARLAE